MEKKRKLSLERKHNLTGWAFLLPAAILIFVFCFYPMIQALMLSFKNGMGDSVRWVGFANYVRILKDKTFLQCLFNTVFYFIIQVPVMLIIALVLAQHRRHCHGTRFNPDGRLWQSTRHHPQPQSRGGGVDIFGIGLLWRHLAGDGLGLVGRPFGHQHCRHHLLRGFCTVGHRLVHGFCALKTPASNANHLMP